MASEVTELAVRIAGEDFAAVAAEELDGGGGTERCASGGVKIIKRFHHTLLIE